MRINNLAIVVNTHSSMKDLWGMFVGELELYFPNQKVYIFSNLNNKIFSQYKLILYNSRDDFTTQYYNCLNRVKEPYIITVNEDYILYNFVKNNIIKKYLNTLNSNKKISFIRLHKGPNYSNKKLTSHLYFLNSERRHLYSQTATIWKKKKLLELYKIAPKSYIGKTTEQNHKIFLSTEDEIDKISRIKKIKGLYSFYNEKKIGYSNYDSFVFPYLQSVIIKGKWNFKDYKKQLILLIEKYKINYKRRKIFYQNYPDVIVSLLKKIGIKNEY